MPPTTIEPLEIALVALAAATAILTCFNLRSAFLDRAAQRSARMNGPIAMWANAAIWAEIMRLGIAVLILMAGLVRLTLPTDDITPLAEWLWESVTMLLVGATGLLLLSAVHGAESRRLLREYLEPGWDGTERRIRQVSPPKSPAEEPH